MEGNFNDYKPIIYLLAILGCLFFKKNKYSLSISLLRYVLTILVMVMLHSVFFSYNQLWSLFEFSKWALIFIFILVVISRFPSQKINYFIKIYFVINGLYLILTADLIFVLGLDSIYRNDGYFYGLLTNSNMFAFSIVLSYPFIQSMIKYKYLHILLFFNIILLIIASGSRGALICFLFYIFLMIKDNFNLFQSIILLIIVTPLIYYFGDVGFIYKGESANIDGIVATREHFWNARINAIESKPYFGWGYSVNEFTYFSKYVITNLREKGNTILALVEEFGLLLAPLLIFFTLKMFIKSINYYLKFDNRYIAYVLLMVLVNNQFETWLFNFNSTYTILIWFMVLIGMNKNLRNIKNHDV